MSVQLHRLKMFNTAKGWQALIFSLVILAGAPHLVAAFAWFAPVAVDSSTRGGAAPEDEAELRQLEGAVAACRRRKTEIKVLPAAFVVQPSQYHLCHLPRSIHTTVEIGAAHHSPLLRC